MKNLIKKALFALSFAVPSAVQAEVFSDVAKDLGVDFVHFNGMSGEYYFPEMTGQGGALFDYDNDGDLDLFLLQGKILGEGKTMSDATFPSKEKTPRDRLYRNDLVKHADGRVEQRFVDVTKGSGINGIDYGMGVTVGDYNNDGWKDLYVSNYGPNRLWQNNGDGTFAEQTLNAGVDDNLWGTSAAFFDYDADGHLDLYLANYVAFDLDKNPSCYGNSSRRDYCGPAAFKSQSDRLWRNLGNGKFEDISNRALKGYKPGPGLGVTVADLNNDGRIDIYVANDGKPNQMWLNNGDGSFTEDALFSGTAVNAAGRSEASMGVDAADFDGDGDLDLFMTHLMGESNTLYVNLGDGLFEDRSNVMGLGASSLPFTAFGTAWFDYDNDGWSDLLVLNGAVAVIEALAAKGDPYPLGQVNQLFRNRDGKRFDLIKAEKAGANFKLAEVGRGAAFGDIDNDGDVDVALFNNNGPFRLLRNNVGQKNDWLGVSLRGGDTERNMIGATATLLHGKKATQMQRVRVDGSYCSANDPRLVFGLGTNTQADGLLVKWPDGVQERWPLPATKRYHTLIKGQGETVEKTK